MDGDIYKNRNKTIPSDSKIFKGSQTLLNSITLTTN